MGDSNDDTEIMRERYLELIDELRVILPGVQVLFAFLITAPFSGRFGDLSHLERAFYAEALIASTLALILLMTPVSYHRLSDRHDRHDRIHIAIRLKMAGLLALGFSIAGALMAVTSFVFDPLVGALSAAAFAIVAFGMWVVLPIARRESSNGTGRS